MQRISSSLASLVLAAAHHRLVQWLDLPKVKDIHPLTLLHLPFHRLLVILAAVIPAAISFAFAERAAFLVRREINSAVLTSLRSPLAEQPPIEQSLS